MGKNYVLHSTLESREQHTTSLLAIFETIFFVLLTWGVAYYYDTYAHIYTAIAIAPFLLLKTPKSTKKAIELFLYEVEIDEKNYYKQLSFWMIVLITSLLSFIISYFFSIKILIHYNNWNLFFYSSILGFSLLGSKVGVLIGIVGEVTKKAGAIILLAVILLETIFIGVITAVILTKQISVGISIVIGIAIGIATLGVLGKKTYKLQLTRLIVFPFVIIFALLLGICLLIKSILIKFFTTFFYCIKYPIETFLNIFKNWHEQIIVNDIFYTPELLPNINIENPSLQLSGFLYKIINEKDIFRKTILFPVAPIWSLGYLYRFSIKSTAWFFFPLAYLANLNGLQNEDKKLKAMKTQTWKKLFWFNVAISAVLLLYFNYTGQYIELLGISKAKLAFLTKITALLRQYIIKDAMWLLVVAVTLYFIMNIFVSRKEHLSDSNYHIFSYWIIKLIFVLWIVFLGWHLVVLTNHFVLPMIKSVLSLYF